MGWKATGVFLQPVSRPFASSVTGGRCQSTGSTRRRASNGRASGPHSSPTWAFAYLATAMAVSLVALQRGPRTNR